MLPVRTAAVLAALMPVIAVQLMAQQPDAAAQLRLAQGFERSGEWDKAVVLYEELYQSAPDNFVYFDGLRRGYTQLKEYEKAVQIVRRRLALTPADAALTAGLGGLYFQMGQRQMADSLWDSVVKRDSKNVGLYRLVASQLIEYRLYEEATRMYLNGRAAAGTPSLFAEELASLYAALLQFEAATREYIGILATAARQPGAAAPQLAYVQSRLASFTARPEGLQAALGVVRGEVSSNPSNVLLRRLLAWLVLERRDYHEALEEYRIIDRLGNGNGSEIFSFAQRAARDGAHSIAARAFRDVMEHAGAGNLLPQSRLGLARSLEYISAASTFSPAEEGSTPSDTASRPVSETRLTPDTVLNLYQELANDYRGTEVAAQAWYRIGVLRHERLYDLDGARSAFQEVRTMPAGRALASDASFRIADILIEQNNLRAAREELSRLLRQPPADVQRRARFGLAELDYFEARFDSSLSAFSALTADLADDLANDAIGYLGFLRENSGAPEALRGFAAAELTARQRHHALALARFRGIITNYPSASLVDDAWMRIGDLLVQLQKPDSAVAAYRIISDSLPWSALKDRALLKQGEVLEQEKHDLPAAIATYELLLTRFPSSLFAPDVRKRIRFLRGDLL